MNRTTAIILLAIIIIVPFFLGMFLGAFLGRSQAPGKLNSLQQQQIDQLQSLKSSAVNSIVLFGNVKSISGKTITLSLGNDDISFKADDSTKVFLIAADSSGKNKPVEGKFSDIKVGKNIDAATILSSDNQLVASAITIF